MDNASISAHWFYFIRFQEAAILRKLMRPTSGLGGNALKKTGKAI